MLKVMGEGDDESDCEDVGDMEAVDDIEGDDEDVCEDVIEAVDDIELEGDIDRVLEGVAVTVEDADSVGKMDAAATWATYTFCTTVFNEDIAPAA